MRKYLVTMLLIIHELPLVDVPIRANVFGTIPLERFFSCWLRISHLDVHFTNNDVPFASCPVHDVVAHFPGVEP
jgi:hypothetical protein